MLKEKVLTDHRKIAIEFASILSTISPDTLILLTANNYYALNSTFISAKFSYLLFLIEYVDC